MKHSKRGNERVQRSFRLDEFLEVVLESLDLVSLRVGIGRSVIQSSLDSLHLTIDVIDSLVHVCLSLQERDREGPIDYSATIYLAIPINQPL